MGATASPTTFKATGRRRPDLALLATHLVLIAACLAILLPVLWTVRTSLASRRLAYQPADLWFAPTLANYRAIFADGGFLTPLWNSLWIGLASALLCLALGSLAAYVIARHRTGGAPLRFAVLGTQMLPPVALVIPFYLLVQRAGLLDRGWAIAVVYLSFNLPFVVWILIGFFHGIPPELEEAAFVDGATPLGAYRRIVLPLAAPGLMAAGVFAFVLSWNEFLFALILTGREARTVPVALAGLLSSQGNQIGPICAATVSMMTPIVALTWVIQRFLVRGLTFGAVK